MASGQDLVKIAQAENGTKENGTNNVKYNTWFYGHEVDGSNYPWCAVFVSWCADKAGITTDIMPKTASAGYFAHYANQGHGEVFTNKNPEAGDLFLINYNGSDWANHVGIVASCDGSNITTIEGNSSDMVRSRTLSMSGLTFVHFNLDSSSGMTAAWTAREVPNIGRDLATKAYMAYQLYTDKSSGGYSYLWGSNSTTANGGLRKYKEFYCVAMGSYYGPDGTFIKVEFDDGKTIYCVKADEKKDSETDSKHMYHDYPFDRNVLEFIIDRTVVRNNDEFTSALNAAGINRSARIKAIWTSDSEPTYGGAGSTTAENEKADYNRMKSNVMEEVRRIFKPEFLNRIDEIIVFHALTKEHMKKIVGIMTKELQQRCREQLDLELKITDGVKQYIVDKAYDPKYGARPLRRMIQTKLEDTLADELLSGAIKRGSTVTVRIRKDEIVFC